MTSKARSLPCLVGVLSLLGCDPGMARFDATRDPVAPTRWLAGTTVTEPLGSARAPRLEIVTVVVPEAEDGRGARVVAPPAPRALDVHGTAWRGRALDPVLRIGALRFHHYTFPAKDVMRFVVDDVARLHDGDEASLQWGEEASERVVLTRSLEVPR